MAVQAPTYSAVVTHATVFLAELLSDPLLRRHILSAAAGGNQHPAATLQALSLFSDALDVSATAPSLSSLRAAERLLLSLPAATPLSCLLLALASAARRRGGAAAATAAASMLDLFALDPALARHELAPAAFEALFAPHLLPVMQHFTARRAIAAAFAGGDQEGSVEAAAMSAMRVLSLMSGAQAQEMKGLERDYERVLDVNCRAYAMYLKKIVQAGETARGSSPPPELVFRVEDDEKGEEEEEEEEEETTEESDGGVGSQNGVRYNPIWADEEQSAELYPRQNGGTGTGRKNLSRPPSLYPQRVPPHLIVPQQQPPVSRGSPASRFRTEHAPAVAAPSDDSMEDSSSELYAVNEEKNTSSAQSKPRRDSQLFPEKASSAMGGGCGGDGDSVRQAPPKDFVCPITSQVFDDPVTLETGQTYERRAIQEWLDRGNATCPITRQRLQSTQLPKTNYVLKRLIAAWREQAPAAAATPARMESGRHPAPIKSPSPDTTSSHASAPSPTSVIAQASYESAVGELRASVSCLCTSEVLVESEMAVLKIERLWREAGGEAVFVSALSRPAVINGFVEILFNSVSAQVLQVAVCLLADLATKDGAVVQTLTRVDSDVDCLVALFKKSLVEAAVLIYLLSPSPEQLVEMDMVEALVSTIRRGDDDSPVKMCLKPRAASVLLLSQILGEGGPEGASSVPRSALMSERFVRSVIVSLEGELVEERVAAVRILQRCIGEDGHCRSRIIEKCTLTAVFDSFHVVGNAGKFDIVRFLCELLKLKKLSAVERVLRMIKDEGDFSMMHTLLVYLQSTPPEQSPAVAGLLLQLDLLVEPRKISMYREEAVDSLIACLKNTDFPKSQLLAAETIMNLPGKFSSSGRPVARSALLKLARVKERHQHSQSQELSIVRGDGEDNMEEEKVAAEWERKVAYALASHEFGLVFEALAEGMKSKNAELFTTCLVCATWLVHMLSLLPDTGVSGAARVCLLRQFVLILRSAKHASDRILAMVALRSFMNDHEGMHDITMYIKDVLKTLREMKKSSGLAFEMLKLLSDGQESSIDMWNHKELNHADCSANGEVMAIVYFQNFIFSGHSDGTLKVWEGSENLLRHIHEAQEHKKAITSLAFLHSEEKLYSGSLDKTIRVWQFREGLRCVEVHDTKDPVHNLTVANTMACFIPQGAGIKVLNWHGNSKILNPNKYVRSMALVHGRLFCGCNDSSIQEIDLASGTLGVIQSGNKKLLGKPNPIYALQVYEGLLYTGSNSLDGISVKIWNSSNYNLVGSIPSSVEVRSLVVTADLIYLGSRTGAVEIWSREKLAKIGTLQAGSGCRVQCMAVNADGDVLVVGTYDGRIQAWGLT